MRKYHFWVGLGLAAFVASGCTSAPKSEAGVEFLTVKNAKYGDQDIPANPKRIVAFDYGVLDSIIALGAEDKIAGLPKSNLPPVLADLGGDKTANVGTLFEPNFELLYSLKPDLIIVSGRAAAKIGELRKIAPTISIEIENDRYYESFKENTELLGRIVGKEAEATGKLNAIESSILSLAEKSKASNKKGLIALYTSGKVSVYGPKSRFGILHQDFGVAPADAKIVDSNSGQVVNFEYFKSVDPDYIFVIDRAKVVGEETLARSFFENELMQTTKAYKGKGLVFLDTESWYTVTGGLQSMSKMISEVSRVVNSAD